MALMDSGHPLADDLDWLLNRVWLGFGEARAAALEPLGLTVREHVLMSVLQRADVTQLELGALARVDKSVLTTTIDALEAKRLVTREADAADRRVRRPRLTAAGTRLCARADAASDAVQQRLLSEVPAGDRQRFVEIVRELALGPFADSVVFSQTAERSRRTRR
jgi:DNA-binding MarR family transcriptional regulator